MMNSAVNDLPSYLDMRTRISDREIVSVTAEITQRQSTYVQRFANRQSSTGKCLAELGAKFGDRIGTF